MGRADELGGSGAATVELITLGWLSELFGLPDDSDGAFVSGGSVANLTALAAARTARLGGPDERAVVYLSDQAHAAVTRALRVRAAPGVPRRCRGRRR
jgi:aromatic-L-amino-acid decarboxylase